MPAEKCMIDRKCLPLQQTDKPKWLAGRQAAVRGKTSKGLTTITKCAASVIK